MFSAKHEGRYNTNTNVHIMGNVLKILHVFQAVTCICKVDGMPVWRFEAR
jgi:hypothetical protein